MGSGPPPSNGAARRAELADFLKARRAALHPDDVGLPVTGRRRTPGLRREEVADRAGVGLSWYTWLEQGRDITPSAQVLEALARALELTADGREHLFALAGAATPISQAGRQVVPAETDTAEIAQMVRDLAPHPAYLLDERFDVLAHNAPAELVLSSLLTAPPGRRNLLLWLFDGRDSWDGVESEWAATARANLLDFRLAHAAHTGEARFERLVDQLAATGATFRAWWAEHDVAALEPAEKTLRHPELGPLHVRQLQTRLTHEPTLRLRILVPGDEQTRQMFASRFG